MGRGAENGGSVNRAFGLSTLQPGLYRVYRSDRGAHRPREVARVHRSYIVNLDEVVEIKPTDGGDARIKMKDGSIVPCSRRYREGLKRVAA